MTDPRRTVALVLAAGAASRFGAPKLLALLDGRPMLQHVVDVATSLPLAGVVVVLGAAADAIEAAVDWRTAQVARNPHPDAGLSSSVRVGLDVVRDAHPDAEAVVILLGDQPLVRRSVVARLLAIDPGPERSVIVPRYGGGGGPNPALLRADAWSLAEHATGDRGLGPVLAAHPELVLEVPIDGDNPDIDTQDDLVAVAHRWATDANPSTNPSRPTDPSPPTDPVGPVSARPEHGG